MTSTTAVKDPVCGMDIQTATADGHTEFKGETYYFCGSKCKEKFNLSADQYTDKSAVTPKSEHAAAVSVSDKNVASAGLISVYRKRAKRYDRSTLLLYLAGFRHRTYRRLAIQSLALSQGDTVVDIGCGTGLNFSLLQEKVGPRGKIIGVDLTDAMLTEASAQIATHGWANVQLVKSDAAVYVFPAALDGILSTFALTLVPKFDEVVRTGASSLLEGKRFVILDFKRPSGWLMNKAAPWLAKLLTGPFGGTLDMASRKPWQSLEKYLSLIQFTNLYLGGAYIAAAEKARSSG